jgi:hypothetical protein
MAVTSSGLYFPTWRDVLDTTQLAVDLDLDTHKAALFLDTITPSFTADTAYGVAPYNAGEVPNGGGYTTGGKLLTGTAVDESPAGTLRWTASNLAWTSSTIVDARCALIYADALAGDNALVLVDFGDDYTTAGGTFTVAFSSGVVLTWQLVPS